MEWWKKHFNKEPDYNYIVGVLLDIWARQKGVEITHYEVVVRPEKAPVNVSKKEAI